MMTGPCFFFFKLAREFLGSNWRIDCFHFAWTSKDEGGRCFCGLRPSRGKDNAGSRSVMRPCSNCRHSRPLAWQ